MVRMISAFTGRPQRPSQSATVSPRVSVPVSSTSTGAHRVVAHGSWPAAPLTGAVAAVSWASVFGSSGSAPVDATVVCSAHDRAQARTKGSWIWAR